jgi:hypothetical protein
MTLAEIFAEVAEESNSVARPRQTVQGRKLRGREVKSSGAPSSSY